jgi:poly(3-hydroxybutyrate) depolymerase
MIFLRLSLTITIAVLCSFSIYASDSQYDSFKKKIEIPLAASLPINGFTADYCVKEPRSGTSTLNCEGLSFKLHVPEVCLIKSCGLIVDAHGWLMDARIQDRNTRLSELGGEKGYIVLNPQAKKTLQGRSWSAKDDKKVLAIINSVETVFQVMSQRIHFTGFSQGAYMTWRFVCKYSKKFGSVAPIAHGAGNYISSQRPLRIRVMDNCFGSNELDILYAHGSKDALVHFSGAINTVKKIGSEWQLGNAKIISEDDNHKLIRFINSKGTKLEFLSYDWASENKDLLGHCFPGSGTYLGCGESNPINWGEQVLKFFIDNPKVDSN